MWEKQTYHYRGAIGRAGILSSCGCGALLAPGQGGNCWDAGGVHRVSNPAGVDPVSWTPEHVPDDRAGWTPAACQMKWGELEPTGMNQEPDRDCGGSSIPCRCGRPVCIAA